jgi:ATP synthase protein I
MAREPRRSQKAGKAGPGAAGLMGVGLQVAASILLFLFAGRWLDARLGTGPWLLMLGVFAGFGASFYSIYRRLTPPRGGAGGKTTRQ